MSPDRRCDLIGADVAAAGERLAGIDAWRGGLMLVGVLLHAIPDGSHDPLFVAIDYLSSRFRMGTFVALSGFLTGIVAGRHRAAVWLPARMRALLMPTLTGLALTLAVMAALPGGPGAIAPYLNWHHIWFLMALLTYLPLAGWFAFGPAGLAVGAVLRGATSPRERQARAIGGVGVAAFALFAAGAWIKAAVPTGGPTMMYHVPAMLGFAPLYVAGIFLGRDPAACLDIVSDARLPAVVLCTIVAIDASASLLLPAAFVHAGVVIAGIASVTAPVAASLLVLRSALAIDRVPPWMRALSAASLTIYLVHYPVIKLLHAALPATAAGGYATYAVVVAVATLLSWTFHVRVVARSPWMAWLFNGRPVAPPPRIAAPS